MSSSPRNVIFNLLLAEENDNFEVLEKRFLDLKLVLKALYAPLGVHQEEACSLLMDKFLEDLQEQRIVFRNKIRMGYVKDGE